MLALRKPAQIALLAALFGVAGFFWARNARHLSAIEDGFGEIASARDSVPSQPNGFDISNATIPKNEIFSGGPPRDGIPAIDKPKFVTTAEAGFLRDDDLVVSYTIGGKARAYPLRVLVWHEIVNDDFEGQSIAVTYCPLCGTAMVFDRRVGERALSFGVSGLLYQSDVLMYDRQTESLWSQLAMKSVAGPLVNTPLDWLPSAHLTWAAWKAKHPGGQVLSPDTGFQRDYEGAAYAGYEDHPETMFPVPAHRQELPRKEWVAGILVNGTAKAYPLKALAERPSFQDRIGDLEIEVEFDAKTRLLTIRRRDTGELLPYVKAYWFAWQAFYPATELWEHP